METTYNSMEVMRAMVDFGNPNSVTDVELELFAQELHSNWKHF